MDLLQEDVRSKYIKARNIALAGALLPGLGCYFVIAWTYAFQMDVIRNFTTIECPEVHSIMPPVSYTIGVWAPQRHIWLFVMFAHFPPRLLFIILYRRMFLDQGMKANWYSNVSWCYFRTLWLEVFGLIGVTIIDINTNFVLHAVFYVVWLVNFGFNMLFNVLLHHYGGIRDVSNRYNRTWYAKLFLLTSGFLLGLSTAITYPLFMATCSPNAYVAFSIAEYILVGYNSVFYFVTILEFPRVRVRMGVEQKPRRALVQPTQHKLPL